MNSTDELAERQLQDYDDRNPGTIFAEGGTLTVAGAYTLQEAVANLRRERGEMHIGYKVGCTSPVIRDQLGIDHSVAGHLWGSERRDSGCTLHLDEFDHPAIEGEFAVELTGDLNGTELTDSEIAAAVGCVFPVIELHHAVFRGAGNSAAELIGNNALNAGFVAGETRSEFRQLDSVELLIRIDGTVIETCKDLDWADGIIHSLRWLAGHLASNGRSLQAGQTILTGSLPPLIPVTTAAEIQIETSHFGNVAAQFVA